jgi:putative transposase
MKKRSKDLVVFHISLDELNTLIRKVEKNAKKVNRLHFIRQMYNGHSVQEACSILDIPLRTGYNWLKKWNEEGPDGLNHKKGAGRPSFLTEAQLKEVNEYIKSNGSLGTKDVHYFIENNFDTDYCLTQVRAIIKKLKYGWIKPYPIYSKSPKNAKKLMKKAASKIDPDKDIYGFFDESAMQNTPNISRVLKKRGKKHKVKVNPKRFKISAAGFQSPNGKSTLYTAPTINTFHFEKALLQIRMENK